MESAAEMAGFFGAHAVWSVSDGETLTPILAFESADGERTMNRLANDRLEDAAAMGREMLAKNRDNAARGVLIYDGFITLDAGKLDALIMTVRDYEQGDGDDEVTIAIPYRPASSAEGFAVHRPKFIGFKGSDPDWRQIGEAMFRGVDQHEKGAAVWAEYLDESR